MLLLLLLLLESVVTRCQSTHLLLRDFARRIHETRVDRRKTSLSREGIPPLCGPGKRSGLRGVGGEKRCYGVLWGVMGCYGVLWDVIIRGCWRECVRGYCRVKGGSKRELWCERVQEKVC